MAAESWSRTAARRGSHGAPSRRVRRSGRRGRSLATQDSGLVRLWALPEEGLPTARVPLDGGNSFAALSPDGALAIPTGMTFVNSRWLRSTRAHHVATGQPAGPALRTS